VGKLNARLVDTLVDPGRYEDGDGLRLVIGDTGRKRWEFRYQIHGRRREMGLGSFPAVSLKDARQAALNARTLLNSDLDPLAERDAQRTRQAGQRQADQARQTAFREICADYIATHCGHLSDKRRKAWTTLLETHAYPVLGDLPASEISTDTVVQVLRPIWTTKSYTAEMLRGRLERVLDAAKVLGLRTGENPARWRGHLDNVLSRAARSKGQAGKRLPSMPWRDLPNFMARLVQDDSRDALAMRLLLLTAARSHMVRFAAWEEMDLEAGDWILPGQRMKMRKPYAIPLPSQAVELLRSIPHSDGSRYVFPGAGKLGAMHAGAYSSLLLNMGEDGVTTHGFRATFRTWASECTDAPREICELCLAHDERGKIEAAYNRSNYLEKRRELMQQWADWISSAC
jgi:integrase